MSMTAKELAALRRLLIKAEVHKAVIGLVDLISGTAPRQTIEDVVDQVSFLQDPNDRPAPQRDIDQVKQRTNNLEDPHAPRGSVVAKPTELDAPLPAKKPRKK